MRKHSASELPSPEFDIQQRGYAEDLGRRRSEHTALHRRLLNGSQAPRVLIADDDANLRMLLMATLASRNLQLLQAATGTQALALVQEYRPQVALLDIWMPELDGFEVCARIKANAETMWTRVVIITGSKAWEDRQRGAAVGADGYLTKPFSPVELLELLNIFLLDETSYRRYTETNES